MMLYYSWEIIALWLAESRGTSAEGGKFIMYPASVSGQFQNNKVQK